MTDIFVTRTKAGALDVLIPSHESDLEAIKKLPKSQPLRVKVTRIRNVRFFRKWWALVDVLWDLWEPDEEAAPRNKDTFRKDLTILAGHYEQWVRLDGSIRTVAKSISFAKMSEDDFTDLFDKTIDVGIKYVCVNYTGDDLRAAVEQVEQFDGNGL